MIYTLALEPADEALIEDYAARENLSVPDFIRRTLMDAIKRRAHVPRPKVRDEIAASQAVVGQTGAVPIRLHERSDSARIQEAIDAFAGALPVSAVTLAQVREERLKKYADID